MHTRDSLWLFGVAQQITRDRSALYDGHSTTVDADGSETQRKVEENLKNAGTSL
jgi:hypothetical protein